MSVTKANAKLDILNIYSFPKKKKIPNKPESMLHIYLEKELSGSERVCNRCLVSDVMDITATY